MIQFYENNNTYIKVRVNRRLKSCTDEAENSPEIPGLLNVTLCKLFYQMYLVVCKFVIDGLQTIQHLAFPLP